MAQSAGRSRRRSPAADRQCSSAFPTIPTRISRRWRWLAMARPCTCRTDRRSSRPSSNADIARLHGFTRHAVHAADERGRVHRHHRVTRSEPGVFGAHHIQLLPDLRRPGGDRDREHAAVQRDAGGAGAADRDLRHPESDRKLAVGRAAGVRRDRRAAPSGFSAASSAAVFRSSTATSIWRPSRRRARPPTKRCKADFPQPRRRCSQAFRLAQHGKPFRRRHRRDAAPAAVGTLRGCMVSAAWYACR